MATKRMSDAETAELIQLVPDLSCGSGPFSRPVASSGCWKFNSTRRISKPKHTRLRLDLETLIDPSELETFQAMIDGKFSPLPITNNGDTDIDSMITTFNTAVLKHVGEILDKHRQKKKPWVS